MDLSDWLFLGFLVLVGIPLSVIAIRFGVTFDFNKWQERRDRLRTQKLRALCPHVVVRRRQDGEFEIEALLFSPPGTLSWTCRRCGIVTHDPDVAQQIVSETGQHPDVWVKREKRFQKFAKKYMRI